VWKTVSVETLLHPTHLRRYSLGLGRKAPETVSGEAPVTASTTPTNGTRPTVAERPWNRGTMRYRKAFRKPNRFKRTKKYRQHKNRHHLTPKSRDGDNNVTNILWIDMEKHQKWHALWGNRTLEEIISLLTRLQRMKHRS